METEDLFKNKLLYSLEHGFNTSGMTIEEVKRTLLDLRTMVAMEPFEQDEEWWTFRAEAMALFGGYYCGGF